MRSKKLLVVGLLMVLILGSILLIYNKNSNIDSTGIIIDQAVNSNNTGNDNNFSDKKMYSFTKNNSGDYTTQIDELGVKIKVKNNLLKENCEKYSSNVEECMKMWEDTINEGISLDKDGRLVTSEEDGSIKILSNISKEEINKNITTNNCVVENEYETEIILGYSSGVQLISPFISDEYGAQYCDYATNIIFDMTYNKTILIYRSHQDSFLLPNMSVIEFL